mmetsp:Transcript_60697/g.172534  ORF Transcript_60697/g.172534 Transcript_60697/m.172534 type:complete len:570 (-) Transcript_60697:47-1756(-)
MARRERTASNGDATPCVKLFVASSGFPYKPRWSPQAPVVFFLGGAAAAPPYVAASGHFCAKCKDLACALLQPDHDDVFLVDLSQIASAPEWRDELQKLGRGTKMLAKWFIKFNPSDAVLVVQAMDVGLIDSMLRSWSAPCSSTVEKPVSRVVVVGSAPKKSLEKLAELTTITVVNHPSMRAVVAAVSGREKCGVSIRDVHFVSVEFSLDPYTKGLLQTPVKITASVLQTTKTINLPDGFLLDGCQTALRFATHHLDFGMPVHGLVTRVVSVESAGSMMKAVLADCHGTVEALLQPALQANVFHGAMLSVDGHTIALAGRLFLLVNRAEPAKLREGYGSARTGQRNCSQRVHRYSCLVLRGSKCLLTRDGDKARLPMVEPAGFETQRQAATRAIREACRINAEEVAMLHDVPPAIAYDTSDPKEVSVLTVFAAVATSAPPDVGCGCEPVRDEGDLYDWYSFDEATWVLRTTLEISCLQKLVLSLVEAAAAGAVDADAQGCFRPAVAAVDGGLSLGQLMALAPAGGPAASLTLGGTQHVGQHGGHQHGGRAAKKCKGSCCGPGGCKKKGCC